MPGRRWVTWLIFGLCALLVVDVLGWATWRVLGLERAERAATAQADTSQRERLALWQMDSLVSALIARESARPYFEFRPRFAADLPYDRAWRLDEAGVIARSPLAAGTGDPIIRLHYQVDSDGRVVSPQADIDEVTPDTGVLRSRRLVRELMMNSSFEAEQQAGPIEAETAAVERSLEQASDAVAEPAASPVQIAADRTDAVPDEAGEGLSDADLRQQLFDIARSGRGDTPTIEPRAGVDVGLFQPRWLFDPQRETELVFERSVVVGGEGVRQGLWLDWPALRAELLAVTVRQLPDARITPVTRPTGPSSSTLATIPLRLESSTQQITLPLWTPTRLTLVVTWIAAVTSLTAIGLVLRAAMSLAERRGRFVTAVTHELRSPLTSFRLSTDLLARTDDESKRREHIESLRREARRLAAVVENVLAYAGLKQKRDSTSVRTLGEILEPLIPAFRQRCAEVGAAFEPQGGHDDRSAWHVSVRVSPGSVERVLSNLIDNACRYGIDAPVPTVCLGLETGEGSIHLVVSDNGTGIPPAERDRIFGDFFRGEGSSRSHSGMGLGLALARGLARAEGGELCLVNRDGPGAAFKLVLPIVTPPNG